MICRFHDSFFAGHLGVSRTVFRLQSRVYLPGLCQDERTYMASCAVCLACKYPCRSGSSLGSCSNGLVGLIGYVSQGKSMC